jgi:hypothetical protein
VRLHAKKVLLAASVAWTHAQRVYISPRPVHAKPVGAKGVDGGVGILHVLPAPLRHAPDPGARDPMELAQNLLTQLSLFARFVEALVT